ncbi:MAG TPA: hypothetical protein PKB02_10660 [Anaerohalosphaeraceae bacterium]|nr:hypothetical protein [Anaerohalosphaeraceae bacterium]
MIERKYFKVYTRASWAASWTARPEIAVLEATRAAAPAIGQARFSVPYGSGKTEAGAALVNAASLASLTGSYIQVTMADDDAGTNEYPIWTGCVAKEEYQPLGQKAAVKTANQNMTAYTLDYLLGQAYIENSFVLEGEAVHSIPTLILFNARMGDGRLAGNRTEEPVSHAGTSTYLFDGCPDTAQLWTVWDILVYAVKRLAPTTGPVFDFPAWYYTTGLEPAEVLYLQSLKVIYSLEGKTLLDVLNELISLARGLTWHVYLSYSGAAEIHIWSVLEEEITLGGVTLPAHDATDRVTLDAWTRKEDTSIRIDRNDQARVDRICVRGARIKATATWTAEWEAPAWALMAGGTAAAYVSGDFRTNDGSLYRCIESHTADEDNEPGEGIDWETYWSRWGEAVELTKGWTDEAQAAYLAGAREPGNQEAYDLLDEDSQKQHNDNFRNSEQFIRVFTEFIVPDSWGWTALSEIVNQKWDPALADFVLDENDDPIQAEYWPGQKQFFPWLPFKEGWDYSTANPVDHYPNGGEDKQRKIMVFAVDSDGAWCLLERTKHAPVIRPLEYQMGVSIRFNPAHLLAKNNWDGAEPSQYDDAVDEFGFDWRSILVTAMVETDQYLSAEAVLNAAAENPVILTLDIPWAELWTVTPGTIVDLDSTNTPVIYGGGYADLRDDRDIVKQVMAAARAWYGRTQYQAAIVTADFDFTATLGTMLVGLDIDGAGTHGSCISAIRYSFGASPKMEIRTAHAGLNFAQLAAAISGVADYGYAGRQAMSQIRQELADVGQSLAAVSKKTHPAIASGSAGFVLAQVVRGLLYPDPDRPSEAGPIEGYSQYILRLKTASYAAWVTGTEYTLAQQRTNDGFLYTCILGHTATADDEPGSGVNWETYWELSSEITALPAGQEAVLGRKIYTVWAIEANYEAGDQRTHQGRLFICIADHTAAESNEPAVGASWQTYWVIITGQYYETTPDMRHFVPWFRAGDIIRLEKRDGFYFFVDTLVRTKAADDGEPSVRWNDTDDRAMITYK